MTVECPVCINYRLVKSPKDGNKIEIYCHHGLVMEKDTAIICPFFYPSNPKTDQYGN